MLTLTIKKQWFDMIASGEKKEEYREIKPYYDSRFRNAFGKPWPIPVILRNGYAKDSPKLLCKCELAIGEGRPEWGAEPGEKYYILKIVEAEKYKE